MLSFSLYTEPRLEIKQISTIVDIKNLTNLVAMKEATAQQNKLARISLAKFILMNIGTFGLFSLFWWYQNWKALSKPTERDLVNIIYWLGKTFISPLCCLQYFTHVAETAQRAKIRFHWDPLTLSIVYICCNAILLLYGLQILTHHAFILFGTLGSFALVPVQATLQQTYSDNIEPLNNDLSAIEQLILVAGFTGWLALLCIFYVCSLSNTTRATIALKNKAYQQAFYLVIPEAENGKADAQALLGYMYSRGLGLPLDNQQAIQWYKKAADQDYPLAHFALGYMHSEGLGIEKDIQQAIFHYKKAAETGMEKANTKLGMFYERGQGTEKDYQLAKQFFNKAAKLGDRNAQYHLGMFYIYENAPTKAEMWLQQSAQNGSTCAQQQLGILLLKTSPNTKSIKKADYWFKKVAIHSHKRLSQQGKNDLGLKKSYVEGYIAYMHEQYAPNHTTRQVLSEQQRKLAYDLSQRHQRSCQVLDLDEHEGV